MLTLHNAVNYSIFDFVIGMSEALDLASPALNNHHEKVAYISYKISVEMGLPADEISDIFFAAILHDVGLFTLSDRLAMAAEETLTNVREHAFIGYMLLRKFEPLSKAAEIIRYHHEEFGNTDVPIGSSILNIADRVANAIDDERDILEQVAEITEKVLSGRFHPDAMDGFLNAARRESFWVEACSLSSGSIFWLRGLMSKSILDIDTLLSFAKTMAQLIDFRSSFTATHTGGVAAVALELTKLLGFSKRECVLMEIAGYLHDLGKLAIPNEILEKNGKLDSGELNAMRKHSYFTYSILCRIEGLSDVAMWAAYHHEKPSGDGYPFHIRGEDLSKLSRVMAVADIFTAITEDRPYRAGMKKEDALKVIENMALQNDIDPEIAYILVRDFDSVNQIRLEAQKNADDEYKRFICSIKLFNKI